MPAEPLYRQIAADLRSKIENGALAHDFKDRVKRGELVGDPADVRLPTESELMEQYTASRNTVRDAIRLLTGWGLVETRPGKGTFVIPQITPLVTTLSKPETGGSGEVDVFEGDAPGRRNTHAGPVRIELPTGETAPKVVSALLLDNDEQLISRHQRRYIDEMPWSMQTSFYSMDLVEQGADRLLKGGDIKEGTTAYLKAALGIEQVGWRDTITVRAPDTDETSFFKLPTDGRVSVIETVRTAYDQHGRRIRVTVTVYPADRNQFVAYFGKVPDAAQRGG